MRSSLVKLLPRKYRIAVVVIATVLLFGFYIQGISKNPPGFYVDESGIAYNAYLIAHTGRGEYGQRFPLFFQFYNETFIEWANPTQIYLLAIPFRFLAPSILLARLNSAVWGFAACLVLGLLARRISGRLLIGALVAIMAMLTPWLFEVGRLVFETFFYPMALALFLFALYSAHRKEKWGWWNIISIAVALVLLTYSYTIGRLLGPMLAAGLILFLNSRRRLLGVASTWLLYAVSLIPLLVFRARHRGALTQRFYWVSYIHPGSTWREVLPQFLKRYFEDLNLMSLLIVGDDNARHHMPGALGSFLIGVFLLSLLGLFVMIVRHSRDPWWRFIVFGTLVSILPGALTRDQFHSLRLIAYPVFLLMLTVPALQYLLEASSADDQNQTWQIRTEVTPTLWRSVTLAVLLAITAAQAFYFQLIFHRDGPARGWAFDAAYKHIYDEAVALPNRPIYLIDQSEPAYMNAYWYATLEGRSTSEFVHLPEGMQAPSDSLVIASDDSCTNCEWIEKSGEYLLFHQREPEEPK